MKAANGACKRWLDDVAIPYRGDECLLFPFALMQKGYGEAKVNGKRIYAHRYVCGVVHGPAPFSGADCCHSKEDGSACEAPACCAPRHLRWGTRKENEADKLLHDTHSRGERCGVAKLTEADVLAIRNAYGVSQFDLAVQYGVAQTTISAVKCGRSWFWL